MEKINFPLDSGETNKIIKWFQIFFGIICIATAITWLIMFPGSAKSGLSFWISFLFLTGFGLYMINSGLGRGKRFIEISDEMIMIKKISFLPPTEIKCSNLKHIKIMPLSIVFELKSSKKIVLRLGTTYTDGIRPLKDAIIRFADNLNIPFEIGKEEL
jgi:hypothetical protein